MSIVTKCVVENCRNYYPDVQGFNMKWAGGRDHKPVHIGDYICYPCILELRNEERHQNHIKNLMVKRAVCEELS